MFEEVYFNKKYQAFIYAYNCLVIISSVAMIVMQYSQKEYMSIFSGMLGVKWLFYMYNYYKLKDKESILSSFWHAILYFGMILIVIATNYITLPFFYNIK